MARASHQTNRIRETADEYRRLAQFLPREQGETLVAGAAALEARASRIDRRRGWPRVLCRLVGSWPASP